MPNGHAFLFNFREIMSKMREFVYFETIFVNSATPAWAKAGKRSPANRLVSGAGIDKIGKSINRSEREAGTSPNVDAGLFISPVADDIGFTEVHGHGIVGVSFVLRRRPIGFNHQFTLFASCCF